MKAIFCFLIFAGLMQVAHGQDTAKIVLVGVMHSPRMTDSSGTMIEREHLFDSLCKEQFCRQYPELVAEASGKQILFVLEGTPSGHVHFSNRKASLHLPECIQDGTFLVGADDRTDWQRKIRDDSCFEDNLVRVADYYRKLGYFPIVVVGAIHVMGIISRFPLRDFDSKICIYRSMQIVLRKD